MGVRFLVVDALNLIRRVYAATPEDSEPGHFDGALQATVQSLRRALREAGPTHVVAIFDGTELTWRHKLYQDYKAGRKPMPELLKEGLERYRAAFDELGVASVSKPDLEADDVAATLATKVAEHDGHAVILSTDKVYCLMISERITIRDHFLKRDLDRGYVVEKFGVGPELLVDFWGLAGNSSTHIPGVQGVGAKTAAKLLEEHGSLEGVLADADAVSGKLGERLRAGKEEARMSRQLAGLRCDLELGWNLKMFRLGLQGKARG
jgi:protein Xni